MEKFKLALPGERWVTVENTNGKNAVSDQGRIASFHKAEPIILKPHSCKNGYLKVIFHKDGKQTKLCGPDQILHFYLTTKANLRLIISTVSRQIIAPIILNGLLEVKTVDMR